MPRQYTKVTADIETSVLAAREVYGPTSYDEIAESLGIPERTVKYILTDLPRMRRMNNGEAKTQASLKERIVEVLRDVDVNDVPELRRLLGYADPEHDIVHVLHSLHSQGKVDFRESGSHDQPINIHLTKRQAKPRVEPEPVVVAPEPEPEPEPVVSRETFPLLADLRARELDRAISDEKATAYIEAAEALKEADPDMAHALLEKAGALNATYPSPLEQEYLRYAARFTEREATD